MAERKQSFAVGEYYHLYNRGVEKRKIFLDQRDYRHFIFLLYVCNTKKSIKIRDLDKKFERGESILEIGAYCLMPNHFHLLAKEKQENGISTYMRKVLTAYSMYFNKKYKRTGTLFESVFKSSHCDTDSYLKYLYSYIHLNPAKLINKDWRNAGNRSESKLLMYVSNYKYSSLQEYLSNYYIVNAKAFPNYFTNANEHKKELFEWLSYADTQETPV